MSRAGIIDLLAHVKKLTALRKAYPALRRGSYHRLYADREVVAFGRWLDQEKLVVVLNASTATKTDRYPGESDRAEREGALGDAFNVDQRWPIVDGVLREVKTSAALRPGVDLTPDRVAGSRSACGDDDSCHLH